MNVFKKFIITVLCGLMFTSFLRAADQPNILWLTSEDHGQHMGCYGDTIANTPNIDALALKGMIYTNAWSTAPCCSPARTTIISGMYPGSTGGEHMRSMVPMPKEKKMYPQFLREAGYYCSNNSKEDYNLIKPDGVWDESSGKAHWLNRKEGQPFFAIFNSLKSHEFQIWSRPHEQVVDPADVRIPDYHPDHSIVRRDWAQYYDAVSNADADAGLRLKELEAAGLAEETIVFYFSDHGSGMPRSKRWPSNSGLEVAMVVYYPEKWKHLAPEEYKAGGTSDRLVDFVDLAPTLLSLAGIKPPDWMQGKAFAGHFESEPKKLLFGTRGRMDEVPDLVRSVTDGRYVYLRNYLLHLSQGQRMQTQFKIPATQVWFDLYKSGNLNQSQSIFWETPRAPEELYDLQNDPDEVHNLANSPDHQDILQRLRNANRDHLLEIRDVCFLPEGEMFDRSEGGSPFDMAKNKKLFPFREILDAAELAAGLDLSDVSKLRKLLKDKDSAVRYWAAMGFLMRGKEACDEGETELIQCLNDKSPYVRIAIAHALALYGDDSKVSFALKSLEELAPTGKNGLLVSMAALTAISKLGEVAMPLKETIRNLNTVGPSPHERYDKYIDRIVARIMDNLGDPLPVLPD